VQLLTSVQYPFMLTTGDLTGDLSKFSMSVVGVENTDCDDTDAVCYQYWDFDILPFLGECDLNGDYVFSFDMICQPSVDFEDCPLDDGTDSGHIDFTLESEYFCPQIIEDIDLSGALYSFEDYARTSHKGAFFLDDTIYLSAVVSSEKATIIQTTLSHYEITLWTNATIVLYNNGNTLAGDLVDFQVTQSGDGTQAHFEYTFDESLFPLDFDESGHITCSTVVDVVYYNTDEQKREIFKRSLESDQQMTMNLGMSVNNKHTPAKSTGFLNLVPLVGPILLAIAA